MAAAGGGGGGGGDKRGESKTNISKKEKRRKERTNERTKQGQQTLSPPTIGFKIVENQCEILQTKSDRRRQRVDWPSLVTQTTLFLFFIRSCRNRR